MSIKINDSLNNAFETIGLLYYVYHPEFLEKDSLTKISSEYGIDGNLIYQHYYSCLNKYLSVFKKNFVKSKYDNFYFEDNDYSFILILQTIFATHIEWLTEENLNQTSDYIIQKTILDAVLDEPYFCNDMSFKTIVNLLKSTELMPNACWKITQILSEPKVYMLQLCRIVNNNLDAFKLSMSKIKKDIDRLLTIFPSINYKAKVFNIPDIEITPILIHPALEVWSSSGQAFIGLFTKEIYNQMNGNSTTHIYNSLLPSLKALSDKSKFDILLTLKQAPKYNLELAEQLNLSAATVSHHMQVLLNCELVFIKKYKGKVYYSLSLETIKQISERLNNIFV